MKKSARLPLSPPPRTSVARRRHTVPGDEPGRWQWMRKLLHVAGCDILDEMGHRQQAMHHRVRLLDPENCVIVGDVLARAAGKASKENATRRELLKGRTLREVYDAYGVW